MSALLVTRRFAILRDMGEYRRIESSDRSNPAMTGSLKAGTNNRTSSRQIPVVCQAKAS